MERQDDAWRRGEYYGEQPEIIPGDEVCVGQDLVNRQMLANQPVGPPSQGYSDATVLALMDPREFSTDSHEFFDRFSRVYCADQKIGRARIEQVPSPRYGTSQKRSSP